MKTRAAAKSHVGLVRKLNEDSYIVAPELGLYAIADGMGGHKAGEVASRMVVETMEDYWRKVSQGKPPAFIQSMVSEIPEEAKHLMNSISFTNMIIHEAQKKPEYHKMGSTLSVLLIGKENVWVANVGDSPIYHFDHDRLKLISEEHSFEAEQKAMGINNDSDPPDPAMKHMLTRVMGLNESVDIHMGTVKLEPGDIAMLCSDGLTNYVPEAAIRAILNDFSISLESKADLLIDEANKGGGGDNITVILLEIDDEGRWEKFKKKLRHGS